MSLSTAERGEIARDPVVQRVIDLFGGRLDNIVPDLQAPLPAAPSDELTAPDEDPIDPAGDEEDDL